MDNFELPAGKNRVLETWEANHPGSGPWAKPGQQLGIRAAKSRWDAGWGRTVQTKEGVFLNRNSLLRFLERHGEKVGRLERWFFTTGPSLLERAKDVIAKGNLPPTRVRAGAVDDTGSSKMLDSARRSSIVPPAAAASPVAAPAPAAAAAVSKPVPLPPPAPQAAAPIASPLVSAARPGALAPSVSVVFERRDKVKFGLTINQDGLHVQSQPPAPAKHEIVPLDQAIGFFRDRLLVSDSRALWMAWDICARGDVPGNLQSIVLGGLLQFSQEARDEFVKNFNPTSTVDRTIFQRLANAKLIDALGVLQYGNVDAVAAYFTIYPSKINENLDASRGTITALGEAVRQNNRLLVSTLISLGASSCFYVGLDNSGIYIPKDIVRKYGEEIVTHAVQESAVEQALAAAAKETRPPEEFADPISEEIRKSEPRPLPPLVGAAIPKEGTVKTMQHLHDYIKGRVPGVGDVPPEMSLMQSGLVIRFKPGQSALKDLYCEFLSSNDSSKMLAIDKDFPSNEDGQDYCGQICIPLSRITVFFQQTYRCSGTEALKKTWNLSSELGLPNTEATTEIRDGAVMPEFPGLFVETYDPTYPVDKQTLDALIQSRSIKLRDVLEHGNAAAVKRYFQLVGTDNINKHVPLAWRNDPSRPETPLGIILERHRPSQDVIDVLIGLGADQCYFQDANGRNIYIPPNLVSQFRTKLVQYKSDPEITKALQEASKQPMPPVQQMREPIEAPNIALEAPAAGTPIENIIQEGLAPDNPSAIKVTVDPQGLIIRFKRGQWRLKDQIAASRAEYNGQCDKDKRLRTGDIEYIGEVIIPASHVNVYLNKMLPKTHHAAVRAQVAQKYPHAIAALTTPDEVNAFLRQYQPSDRQSLEHFLKNGFGSLGQRMFLIANFATDLGNSVEPLKVAMTVPGTLDVTMPLGPNDTASPLHLAMSKNRPDIVRMLLAAGAKRAESGGGGPALWYSPEGFLLFGDPQMRMKVVSMGLSYPVQQQVQPETAPQAVSKSVVELTKKLLDYPPPEVLPPTVTLHDGAIRITFQQNDAKMRAFISQLLGEHFLPVEAFDLASRTLTIPPDRARAFLETICKIPYDKVFPTPSEPTTRQALLVDGVLKTPLGASQVSKVLADGLAELRRQKNDAQGGFHGRQYIDTVPALSDLVNAVEDIRTNKIKFIPFGMWKNIQAELPNINRLIQTSGKADLIQNWDDALKELNKIERYITLAPLPVTPAVMRSGVSMSIGATILTLLPGGMSAETASATKNLPFITLNDRGLVMTFRQGVDGAETTQAETLDAILREVYGFKSVSYSNSQFQNQFGNFRGSIQITDPGEIIRFIEHTCRIEAENIPDLIKAQVPDRSIGKAMALASVHKLHSPVEFIRPGHTDNPTIEWRTAMLATGHFRHPPCEPKISMTDAGMKVSLAGRAEGAEHTHHLAEGLIRNGCVNLIINEADKSITFTDPQECAHYIRNICRLSNKQFQQIAQETNLSTTQFGRCVIEEAGRIRDMQEEPIVVAAPPARMPLTVPKLLPESAKKRLA